VTVPYTKAPFAKLRDKLCEKVSKFLLTRVATVEYRSYMTALMGLGSAELERILAQEIAETPKPENTPVRKTGKASSASE
jgi:hypothetical protein